MKSAIDHTSCIDFEYVLKVALRYCFGYCHAWLSNCVFLYCVFCSGSVNGNSPSRLDSDMLPINMPSREGSHDLCNLLYIVLILLHVNFLMGALYRFMYFLHRIYVSECFICFLQYNCKVSIWTFNCVISCVSWRDSYSICADIVNSLNVRQKNRSTKRALFLRKPFTSVCGTLAASQRSIIISPPQADDKQIVDGGGGHPLP